MQVGDIVVLLDFNNNIIGCSPIVRETPTRWVLPQGSFYKGTLKRVGGFSYKGDTFSIGELTPESREEYILQRQQERAHG